MVKRTVGIVNGGIAGELRIAATFTSSRHRWNNALLLPWTDTGRPGTRNS